MTRIQKRTREAAGFVFEGLSEIRTSLRQFMDSIIDEGQQILTDFAKIASAVLMPTVVRKSSR